MTGGHFSTVWSHFSTLKSNLFSSPEPNAQVSYCHSASSVVRPSVVRPSVNFHIFNFFSRTVRWILMKLSRDEVFMVPNKCCCFSIISAQGWIQGGAKIGHGDPFLQETSSTSLGTSILLLLQTGRLQRQTEYIAMI